MNVNRDGAMRHTITRSQVNYFPNRHQAYQPSSAEQGGYHE
jgi:catalase